MSNVWEFNEELDTAKSFQAFSIYRDLGPTRSVADAFNIYRQNSSKKTASGFFNNWSTKGKWIDRARAFDAEQDKIRTADRTSESRKAHEDRLEYVRGITEELAIKRLEMSLKAACLVEAAIDRLDDYWVNSGEDYSIKGESERSGLLLTLMTIQNKDAATIESALKLADESLSIRELLERIGTG